VKKPPNIVVDSLARRDGFTAKNQRGDGTDEKNIPTIVSLQPQ